MAEDIFGIKKIYETNPNGAKDWYMDHNPYHDSRADEFEGNVQGDGVNTFLEITKNQVRMNVFAEDKNAYDPDKIEYNQQKISNRKYMLLPNDWRNVEITAYVKVTGTSNSTNGGPSHFEWYCRGGPNHTGSSKERCPNSECITCEGVAYHANLYERGDHAPGAVKFEKELEHTTGYYQGNKTNVTGSLMGRWIGYKAVFYGFQKEGEEVVKLEQWLDEGTDNENQPGNTWGNNPVHEDTDVGNWEAEDGRSHCGGTPNQIITWGGPSTTFRSDNISYHFKWASVREIIPPQ